MQKPNIEIRKVLHDSPRLNVQGSNEWQIWVDGNFAGHVYQSRKDVTSCSVSPNDPYGQNSGLKKWWNELENLSDCLAFVKDTFAGYVPLDNQEYLNGVNQLEV